MSETQEVDTAITRRPRADRQVHREETPRVSIEAGEQPEGPRPEAALADVRQQLQQRDRELAVARQQAQAEAARRHQSEAARQDDHKTAVASAAEAAKADQVAARAALRAARESGDVDAETEAVERLSSATYRFAQANAELEGLRTAPAPRQQQPPQEWRPSDAAQRWMDDHPRLNTDPEYQRHAVAMHHAALASLGQQAVGSQQYVDWIEQRMVERYGEGHGHAADGTQQQPTRRDRGGQVRGSESVAPSSGAGRMGGWRTVRTPLGDLLVQDRSDGSRGIRFSDRNAEDNFREGARLDRRYETDPNRALADYCEEHIAAAAEGYDDLKIGEGRTWGTE